MAHRVTEHSVHAWVLLSVQLMVINFDIKINFLSIFQLVQYLFGITATEQLFEVTNLYKLFSQQNHINIPLVRSTIRQPCFLLLQWHLMDTQQELFE